MRRVCLVFSLIYCVAASTVHAGNFPSKQAKRRARKENVSQFVPGFQPQAHRSQALPPPLIGLGITIPSSASSSSAALVQSVDALPAYSEDVKKYDIPEKLKIKNDQDFRSKSGEYEDALKNLQIVLVVDHSGSQGTRDAYPHEGREPVGMYGRKWSQWDNTYMVAKYFAESVMEYDKDGDVPVVFFSTNPSDVVVHDVGELLDQFKRRRPSGSTNLYSALKLAFDNHMPTDPNEGALFVVLTDGQPDDRTKVRRLIKERITTLDPRGDRLNILFVRIGDDPDAIQFLQEMDNADDIGGNVDTKSDNMVYKMGPKNMVLNAIYEHLDSQYRSLNDNY